jgi:WhiB family redox-sensing transcriptional regulator
MTSDWRDYAACRDSDSSVFFPVKGEPEPEAERLCSGCPVRDQCLSDALRLRDVHGYRGGKTGPERHRMLKGSPRRDVLADIRRLKALRWSKKAICLALGVSDYLVDRAGPAAPREAA